MARIAIHQVDGNIPNMALMKISAYHEGLGDSVEHYRGPLWNHLYDHIYASKIFSFSKTPDLPKHSTIGGTGIDWKNSLPPEIDKQVPSWTLYPEYKNHLGFSMRGCRFKCQFCCVPQKEGDPFDNRAIDTIMNNPNGGNRLVLLDNDFFGGPHWREHIEYLIDHKVKVCFIQGLNIRIITDGQADMLAKTNYYARDFRQKYLTFAWDQYPDKKRIFNGIRRCNDAGIPTRHMQFFILVGFNTTQEQDMERILMLKDIGAMPFVMPYNKSDPYQKALARWVNQRAVFNSCTWDEYKYRVNS